MPNSRAAAVEGESTRLGGRFTLISGAFYDPNSFEDVNIYSEDPIVNPSAVAIATITPTKLTTGRWYVDYTFSTPGVYYDKWRYIPEAGDGTSESVETVTVNTLPTSTEKDWTLLATWEDELNSVRQKMSDYAGLPGIKDGSLNLKYDEVYKRLEKQERKAILKVKQLDTTQSIIVSAVRDGWDDK